MDGKEWDLNAKGVMLESEKEFGSELRTTVFAKGNEAWEESCLAKFSEFLGFSQGFQTRTGVLTRRGSEGQRFNRVEPGFNRRDRVSIYKIKNIFFLIYKT